MFEEAQVVEFGLKVGLHLLKGLLLVVVLLRLFLNFCVFAVSDSAELRSRESLPIFFEPF